MKQHIIDCITNEYEDARVSKKMSLQHLLIPHLKEMSEVSYISYSDIVIAYSI